MRFLSQIWAQNPTKGQISKTICNISANEFPHLFLVLYFLRRQYQSKAFGVQHMSNSANKCTCMWSLWKIEGPRIDASL